MELMRDWLGGTIRNALGPVLTWNDGEAHDLQNHRPKYEDDGSNLRVPCPTPGVVQIIKWENVKDPPVQAVVSDSFTRLRATFASSLIKSKSGYRKDSNEELDVGAYLGNVIQLVDSEIVATHLGPRPARLTILVKNFKVIGSDRSFSFGQPRQVECFDENAQLIDKLTAFRAQEDARKHTNQPQGKFLSSPSASSSGIKRMSVLQNANDGQELSSQVPMSRLGAGVLQSAKEQSLAESQDKGHGNLQSNVCNSKSASSTDRAQPTKHPDSSISDNAEEEKSAEVHLIDGKNTSVQKQPEAGELKDGSDQLLKLVLARNSANFQPKRIAEAPQSFLPFENIHDDSYGGDKPQRESSIKAFKVGEGVNMGTKQEQVRAPLEKQRHRRFRRKLIHIPKEQQTLLEREDSWLPAEPGQRDPVANIPISILQTVTKEVEKAAKTLDSPHDKASMKYQFHLTPTPSPKEERAGDTVSESGTPIPSAEWPPSSPIVPLRDLLPPDSSMEPPAKSPEQKVDAPLTFLGDVINQGESSKAVGLSQRQDRVSQAGPQSLHSRPSSRDSSSKHAISIDQDSTEEESPHFLCKVPDCSQTFRKRSGLKYHLLHHHNTTPESRTARQIIVPSTSATTEDKQNTVASQRRENQPNARPSYQTESPKQSHLRSPQKRSLENKQEINIVDLTQESDGLDSFTDSAKEDIENPQRDKENRQLLPSHSDYIRLGEARISPEPKKGGLESSAQTPLHSSAPSSIESDLEAAVPLSLAPKTALLEESSGQEQIATTKPLLRIRQMPYIPVTRPEETTSVEPFSSPSKRRCLEVFENGTQRSEQQPVEVTDREPSGERKRKTSEPSMVSPDPTKRRKVQRRPFALDFSQDRSDMPDPTVMARRYRQEFLESRKSSVSESCDSPKCVSGLKSTPNVGLEKRSTMRRRSPSESDFIQKSPQLATPVLVTSTPRSPVSHVAPEPPLDTTQVELNAESEGSQDSKFQNPFSSRCDSKPVIDVPSTAVSDVYLYKEPIRRTDGDGQNSDPVADTAFKNTDKNAHGTQETDLVAVSQILQAVSSAQVSQDSPKQVIKIKASSGQAQSLPELMTPALSVTDASPMQASNPPLQDIPCQNQSASTLNIFEQFLNAYPDYTGSLQHFVRLCRKIKSLRDAGRMEHRSLWDDFIVRHRTDYPLYLHRCAEAVEDPLPYEKYYHEEVEDAVYKTRIVTPKNLAEALALGGSGNSTESPSGSATPSMPRVELTRSAREGEDQAQSLNGQTSQHQGRALPATVSDRLNKRLQKRKLQLVSESEERATENPFQSSASSLQWTGNRQEPGPSKMIDLTGDDEAIVLDSPPHEIAESPTLSPKNTPRTLPWLSSGETGKLKVEKKTDPDHKKGQDRSTRASPSPTPLSNLKLKTASEARGKGVKSPVKPSVSTASPSTLKVSPPKTHSNDSKILPRTNSFRPPRTSKILSPASKNHKESSPLREGGGEKENPHENSKETTTTARKDDEWWKDQDSPFNKWKREYKAITSGKGNSFAQERDKLKAKGKSKSALKQDVK